MLGVMELKCCMSYDFHFPISLILKNKYTEHEAGHFTNFLCIDKENVIEIISSY